ncbi:L-fucose-proton symporter [Purpureocillium lavendulum]|uniref:ATP-dependent DNA helicase n=1 Tax=Purpureocillium lavendulum TaxID=1247861 RepID=A0AB34FBR1_9HYPO|nr:L-fucose-proton symporter [Purpureocillium lavendulum]
MPRREQVRNAGTADDVHLNNIRLRFRRMNSGVRLRPSIGNMRRNVRGCEPQDYELKRPETAALQRESLEAILRYHELRFRDKEKESVTRSWCKEIPLALQVETAKSFHQAFTDEWALPISHCSFCYRKQAPSELTTIRWRTRLAPSLLRATTALQKCTECFPAGDDAEARVCHECSAALKKGRLPKACAVNNMHIGCEHRYPEELDGLSPLEERLIALQVPFGYITKFTVDNKTPSGLSYRKHVKGHIVVFPNKVEDLVATVLPHPLLETIENIHVSWSGSSKPGAADVGHLLQVRKSRVRAALTWLQKNNPLYEHITIDHGEIDGWQYADGSHVPIPVMASMQREEPSVAEKAQTDHIVPDTDRGLEENRFTSIEEIVASAQAQADHNSNLPDDGTLPSELGPPLSDDPRTSIPGPEDAGGESEVILETTSSGMFPLDGPAAFEEADKLSFLVGAIGTNRTRGADEAERCAMRLQGAGGQPFILVERGADFADSLHEDFFPRTFPKLFPWGRGGPKAPHVPHGEQQQAPAAVECRSNHSLSYWARYVLQRHGGRFATHPVFCFLVFNILLRSSNRHISMVRTTKGSFERVEQVYGTMTEDRLKKAEDEMRETRKTQDADVAFLLRELSIFGHAQPLSNETRLLMRRKIQAIDIWAGTPVIWITINPNDINNPVKMKLAIHRLHDYETAKDLLADLRARYDGIALSTMDPVSSAIFFHREISLFFEKYVRAGNQSVFGKVSHYYATVETNDRGSLHLHGLLWLHGNMELPSLVDDIADPREEEYRDRVVRYVDSVFHECLDEDAGKAIRQERKPIHPVEGMMNDTEALSAAFDAEANFIAHCCQVHSHTYTCIKYSLKGLTDHDADNYRRTACRFKAPWKIVDATGLSDDGLLAIRRNHPLVNRYNKAMAVGLRHNHDVSMILTMAKGLAMVFYITNYATKLDTPMWRRIAHAAEVFRQLREDAESRRDASAPANPAAQRPAVLNQSRQFLMRVANRIFSERQLSAVEVCYHMLGYETDFTNVPHWSFLNLNALGRVLRDICLYDYMSMVTLVRNRGRDEDGNHISLEVPSPESCNWFQKLRRPHEYAVPIFQGFISDDHRDEHPVYFRRNSVLHLALFVPWERFLPTMQGDIADLWLGHEASLCRRLRFHVSNISLLTKSAEDARKDAKLWASRSEGDDTVDVDFPLDEEDDGEQRATVAEHHQNFAALLRTLHNAVRDTDVTRGSPVLTNFIRDLREEYSALGDNPFLQRPEGFYRQIRRAQGAPLCQCETLSVEDVQAAAKAQEMLHLRMLDEMETGPQGGTRHSPNADIDDMLAQHYDTDIPLLHRGSQDIVTQGPRMLVDIDMASCFTELGRLAASQHTLNSLQTMALQLVCRFLDKSSADPDRAGQHLQYTGGPGGTGKSRVIEALKWVFSARGQAHLLQITGTSGSAAAQIGGTTLHSACGLDTHRAPDKRIPLFSEAKKFVWKQKLVLVIDEVSMLGGTTLYEASCRLQSLRDCPDKPFGGIPVVLLMGDFYQFAPVRETSLLVDRVANPASARLSQATVAHHRGFSLWLMFKTVVLLDEQIRARDDPELRALLDRVRHGTQTWQDLDLLNTKLVDRSDITFSNGLRAITPLNRNRWSLNMQAVVDWARFNGRHISVFVSTHTWRRAGLSQYEIAQAIEQGDDSKCKVPGIFFYAQGMPVVVNKNIYTGLKVVNGAEFAAADIITDPKYPGYHLADDVTIHFGPPLAILLHSNDTATLAVPVLPPKMVLVRPISHVLEPSDSRFKFLSTKCARRGLPVVPAFVLTDYKSQSKTFPEVLLELRGNRVTNGDPSKCDFTSLYVQLSRATTLRGIRLLSPVRPQDFIGNKLDQNMNAGTADDVHLNNIRLRFRRMNSGVRLRPSIGNMRRNVRGCEPQDYELKRPETAALQRESLEAILRYHELRFRDKEKESVTRSWCKEIPLALQVETAKSFHQAFTDEWALPISHCSFCYRKQAPSELTTIRWRTRLAPSLLRATTALQKCTECFPAGDDAEARVCHECSAALKKGRLPKACAVNNMHIGCEHRYPEELDGLSPLEERLIALQVPFGYITKFTVDNKTPSGLSYRKHVKGHIVVFPNKVEDLVATVLPHPLLETIENIHVSWSGSSKPGAADVGHLLQVRKSRVRAALTWLQKNNPLYEHITIDHGEIDGWQYADGSHVPIPVMASMQREEPSVAEKAQTDHIVPDTDRGLEENRFTSIEEIVASAQAQADHNSNLPDDGTLPSELGPPLSDDPRTSIPGPEDAGGESEVILETTSSGMFPLDGPAAFEEADKLSFLVGAIGTNRTRGADEAERCAMRLQGAGGQPFILVERGADFADSLHEDFFPRTFPKLFPWGRGGPKAPHVPHGEQQQAPAAVECRSNHSLSYWARYVLQRHGGRFATHPVFCFLVFNILLRSSNRHISMVRTTKGSFERVEQVYGTMTEDRLKKAEDEMRETRKTQDADVAFLLRELSIFGHAQPLSNETRLLMRRKIQAIDIWAGTPVIWITINPNDINNPVKMKLAIHRLHDYETAKDLLADLRARYDGIALSTMDPVSSAIFFHREISLFFEKYVRAGNQSVFGKVSHYYATVETNDRGSLHLHGLLWLHGNMELPSLVDDIADPREEEYRDRVVRYVDSVFHECLDEDAGKAIRQERKPIHPVEGMMNDTEALSAAFDAEANFIAHCCQVHSHTYTCIKYSLKGLTDHDADNYRRTACRFKAPWKIVDATGLSDDGLLAIRRNHPLVNRYNKAMAVGLRHNHDVSMILTRAKGLAMVFYITNYATKLDTPMWRRIAHAAEVFRQLREDAESRRDASAPANPAAQRPAVLNQSRQFLMRVANRIFSERQLSAVEVCYHMLGYETDFTNVPHWSFLNLNALGRVLRDICLYDYMSMVTLVRNRGRDEDGNHISLEVPSPESCNWFQKLRRPHEYAVPIFQGFISDDHRDEHPVYFRRNSVLHLALFVPWERFLPTMQGDIADLWLGHEASLCPLASRSEGDDTVDVDFPLDEEDDGEQRATVAEHHQNFAALLRTLHNAVRDTDVTRGSPVLTNFIRDLREEYSALGDNPFLQRPEGFYRQIRRAQGAPLCQCETLSVEDVQAAAKAQEMLHLRMLDEMETGPQGGTRHSPNADIDDMLAQHYDNGHSAAASRKSRHSYTGSTNACPILTWQVASRNLAVLPASQHTLNSLQTMALQLVCRFLDKSSADPDRAGQHLQYTGGPGGTGKSRGDRAP